MPKYRLSGDICHPGIVEVECTEDELRDLLGSESLGLIDEPQLHIVDEDTSVKVAGFIPDGNLFDEDGNDLELAHEPTPAEELAQKLEDSGVDPSDLDDLVHDIQSREASATNNCGLEEQVEYLIKQLGLEETQRVVAGLIKED